MLRAVRGQEACEQRVLLREAVARGQRAHPHRGLVPLGERDHLRARRASRATEAPTTSTGRRAAPSSAAARSSMRGVTAYRGADLARRHGVQARSQSSTGTDTNVGPRGGCMAT